MDDAEGALPIKVYTFKVTQIVRVFATTPELAEEILYKVGGATTDAERKTEILKVTEL